MKKTGRFLALFVAAAAVCSVFTAMPAAAAEYDDAAEQAVDGILSATDPKMSSLEKALVVHDKLIDVSRYDYENYRADRLPAADFTAEGLLRNRTGVCQGYALAYQLLMDRLGVETICVHSSTHLWNMVKLGGNWYHVDCTFDDPVIVDSGSSMRNHAYFLLSDGALTALSSRLGDADHAFWKKMWFLVPPVASDTQFDAYASNDTTGTVSIPSADGTAAITDTSFWSTASRRELDALEAPVAATVWLDTSSYRFAAGDQYVILAKSNLGEYLKASSSNTAVVSVDKQVSSSGGRLFTIRGRAPGTASVIVTSACGAKASLPVTVTAPRFTCDTAAVTIRAGKTYQFLVTADKAPVFQVATVGTIAPARVSGNRYFYKVTATSSLGVHGVYIDGVKSALCTFA